MGRDWQSPSGNLYASSIVRLRPADPQPATLALVAAVALRETLTGVAPATDFTIKWPNDVLAGGAKISGILLERAGDAVIIGFGVNLASHPASLDRPTISIAGLGFGPPDPGVFCARLAEAFAHWLGIWRVDAGDVMAAWEAAAHPRGTSLAVALGDGEHVDGRYDGLTPGGSLRLRLADGSIRAIHAGDVFLL